MQCTLQSTMVPLDIAPIQILVRSHCPPWQSGTRTNINAHRRRKWTTARPKHNTLNGLCNGRSRYCADCREKSLPPPGRPRRDSSQASQGSDKATSCSSRVEGDLIPCGTTSDEIFYLELVLKNLMTHLHTFTFGFVIFLRLELFFQVELVRM